MIISRACTCAVKINIKIKGKYMSAKNTSPRKKNKHERNKKTTKISLKAHVPAISKNSLCDVARKWCSEHLPWDSGFSR